MVTWWKQSPLYPFKSIFHTTAKMILCEYKSDSVLLLCKPFSGFLYHSTWNINPYIGQGALTWPCTLSLIVFLIVLPPSRSASDTLTSCCSSNTSFCCRAFALQAPAAQNAHSLAICMLGCPRGFTFLLRYHLGSEDLSPCLLYF